MKTKLTLNIEDNVVDKVKALSKKQRRSISSIVENHFKSITASNNKRNSSKPGLTFTEKFRKKFPVSKPISASIDYKKEWHKHLEEKYGG